jgi:hypothetical protein
MAIVVPDSVNFENIWARMSAAEAAIAVHRVGPATPTAGRPELTAEGALSDWGYNAGAGVYTSGAYTSNALAIGSMRKRPDEIRGLMKTDFDGDPSGFINAVAANDSRAYELIANEPPVAAGPPAFTRIFYWDPDILGQMTAVCPELEARARKFAFAAPGSRHRPMSLRPS